MFLLNPVAFSHPDDALDKDEDVSEQDKERKLEMAALINNSPLIKSYELNVQQFEADFEAKNARIRDMERELQQI